MARASTEKALTETVHMTLDVQGLACPLPVLKARKALASMAEGAVLEVLTTEPQSRPRFRGLLRCVRACLLAQGLTGGTYRFLIRKGVMKGG